MENFSWFVSENIQLRIQFKDIGNSKNMWLGGYIQILTFNN